MPVVVVALVLLLIAGVTTAVLVWHGTAEPGAPAQQVTEELGESQPRAQAATMDELLTQSGDSRRKLNQGIERVNRCTKLTVAVAELQEVGDERQAQLSTLAAMNLSAIDNGEQLRTNLTSALRQSHAADVAYVDWAKLAQANGCRPSPQRRAAYAQGAERSAAAQTFKRSFLAAWNPVAAAHGFKQRTIRDI